MARNKKQAAPENHERWLVSYADFITLLFAFFVVMFASSQTDKAKAQQVSESVQKALDGGKTAAALAALVKEILGGTVDDKGKGNAQMKGPGGAQRAAKEAPAGYPAELVPSMKFLDQELKDEIQSGKMEISLQPRGLVISLRQAAFFPSGGDLIAPGTFPIIGKVATAIQQLPNPVRLEGHTDSIPIHTARFRTNWELSAARSIAMLELLAERFSIPRERFSIAGHAETVPVASNEAEEGRAKNRRVDIVILNLQRLVEEPKSPTAPTAPAAAPKKHGA